MRNIKAALVEVGSRLEVFKLSFEILSDVSVLIEGFIDVLLPSKLFSIDKLVGKLLEAVFRVTQCDFFHLVKVNILKHFG